MLLALHFATWVPSLRYTSVASATAIVATQPVWVALIARAAGHDVPRRAWLGIAVSLVAVVVLTGVDFSLEPRALIGDLLALLGGVFAAFYTVAGAEVRRTVTTTTYTALCYSTAAVVLLVACLVGGVDLWGFSGRTWLQLLALTARRPAAGALGVQHGAAFDQRHGGVAGAAAGDPRSGTDRGCGLGQTPPLAALPAAVLLLVGLGIVVSAGGDVEPSIPAE